MADTSNLSNFLGDVADAIRTKKGTTETIPAANFDTEIASIETGSDISDATATANDILAGTTAYIADGKVEGNIQKEEETIGTMIGNSEILSKVDKYNFFERTSPYCNRHNLALGGLNSYPKVISLNDDFVYSQEIFSPYSEYFYFGKTDNSDGTVPLASMYGGYFKIANVDLENKNCVIKHEGLYIPRVNEYDKFAFIPDATNQNRFYTIGRSSATDLAIYLVEGTSYTKLIDVNVGSETVLRASYGSWSPYYIPMDYNPSNTKLLIQIRNSTGSNYKYFGLFIYDITLNSIEYKIWSNDSIFTDERCPFTWYDDNTLLNGNKIQKLENDNIIDIGTINNMSNVVSPKYVKRYNDTGLVLKVMDSSIVAQSIDFANNYVIDEKIILSKGAYPPPCIYDGGISIAAINSSGANNYRSLYKVELTGEKIITKLVREGKSYIDTSKGTATSSDILEGKIAYSNGNKLTGAIPNNGELNITPSKEPQSIPAGYTSGGTVSGDTNLLPKNIKSGTTIFGVNGTLEAGIDTSDANATANDIAKNKTAYVNGEKVTGNVYDLNAGNWMVHTIRLYGQDMLSFTNGSSSVLVRENGSFVANFNEIVPVIGLTADKIVSGNTILGVEGTAETGNKLPDNVFIQSNVPTTTTDEAIWLKEELLWSPDTYIGGGKYIKDFVEQLTDEQKILFNKYPYKMCMDRNGQLFAVVASENPAVITTYDSNYINFDGSTTNNNISISYRSSNSTWSVHESTTINVNVNKRNGGSMSYSNYDIYDKDGVKKVNSKSSVPIVEEGLHIENGEKRYTVYYSNGTDFEKILDTSNADATAGDIVEGKTAFVNNTKITGTLTVPMSQEEYNTALSTANNILGEEVTE